VTRRVLLPAALALVWTVALADPPDSTVNPATGDIEVVDVFAAGGGTHVRHTRNQGQQSLEVTDLSTGSVTEVSPRVAVSPEGVVWATWWRDGTTRQVLVRKHPQGSTWEPERLVSNPAQSSKKPQIVHDGTSPWIAYEYASGNATAIAIAPIIDGPDPITPVTLESTSYTNVDVHVHAMSGHLWVTWVDSASKVGWSEYDYENEQWSVPAEEPYNQDTVADARARIQSAVLSN
jgi:hypothetical protein